MSEQKNIENSLDFIELVKQDENISEGMTNNFEHIWKNMLSMRSSLDKRPCSCGGVNPDAVIAERRKNLEDFYVNWISQLKEEDLEKFKTLMPSNITFKSSGQELLKL